MVCRGQSLDTQTHRVYDDKGSRMQFLGNDLARWLSWLEHRPVTAGVMGSNPIRVAKVSGLYQSIGFGCLFSIILLIYLLRGLSSAGRASALQAEGHRFEPYRPHSFVIRVFCKAIALRKELIAVGGNISCQQFADMAQWQSN